MKFRPSAVGRSDAPSMRWCPRPARHLVARSKRSRAARLTAVPNQLPARCSAAPTCTPTRTVSAVVVGHVVRRSAATDLCRGHDRHQRVGEDREGGVAFALRPDEVASRRGDHVFDERIVPLERDAHLLGLVVPQSRRADEIGEHECPQLGSHRQHGTSADRASPLRHRGEPVEQRHRSGGARARTASVASRPGRARRGELGDDFHRPRTRATSPASRPARRHFGRCGVTRWRPSASAMSSCSATNLRQFDGPDAFHVVLPTCVSVRTIFRLFSVTFSVERHPPHVTGDTGVGELRPAADDAQPHPSSCRPASLKGPDRGAARATEGRRDRRWR